MNANALLSFPHHSFTLLAATLLAPGMPFQSPAETSWSADDQKLFKIMGAKGLPVSPLENEGPMGRAGAGTAHRNSASAENAA